jgi:hypothetical protein
LSCSLSSMCLSSWPLSSFSMPRRASLCLGICRWGGRLLHERISTSHCFLCWCHLSVWLPLLYMSVYVEDVDPGPDPLAKNDRSITYTSAQWILFTRDLHIMHSNASQMCGMHQTHRSIVKNPVT